MSQRLQMVVELHQREVVLHNKQMTLCILALMGPTIMYQFVTLLQVRSIAICCKSK